MGSVTSLPPPTILFALASFACASPLGPGGARRGAQPIQDPPQGEAGGATNDEDLAKKLANPVADLISVPLQFNWDEDIGPGEEGERLTFNFQPVVPISLTPDLNLISRTILPTIWQDDILPGAGDQFGLGDTVQSFFLSPAKPGGAIWGVGPVALIPTGTDDLTSARKWGIGPTGVGLAQEGPWTYGALANHIWSLGGDHDREDVSSTFLQPFLAYTTKTAWTFTLNSESTFDWREDEWLVPVHALASKLVPIGGQRVSLQAGLRYWAESPDAGPEGFGIRAAAILLFPKRPRLEPAADRDPAGLRPGHR